jgi:hypothetical protein
VGEKVFKEDGGGAWGRMLRTAAKHVLGGAAKHTTRKAKRVRALKVREQIHRIFKRPVSGSWLIALHCLLGGRRESTSKTRNIVGLVGRRGRGGSMDRRDRSDQDRSSKSSGRAAVFLFAKDSFSN